MKRIISVLIVFIITVGLIGCKSDTSNEVKVNLYDSKKAIEVAKEYLIKIQEEDFQGAKSLCTDDFSSMQKQNSLGNSKIQSFKINKTVEGGDKSSVIFDVIRGKDHESSNNLDQYNLNIVKEGENYKINDLNIQEKAEVYSNNSELRIKKSSEGESKLLLRLSDIPRQVYNKEGESLEEINVPSNDFSCVSLSYTADKVAYVTIDGNDSFIGVLYVKEKDAVGTIGSAKNDPTQEQSDNTKGSLEKVETDKMNNFGVLRDCQIERLVFNSLEDELLVSYKAAVGGTGLKIFNIENGKESLLNLENTFPTNKYNIKIMYTGEDDITIKVTLVEGINELEDEKSGIYTININKATITKE